MEMDEGALVSNLEALSSPPPLASSKTPMHQSILKHRATYPPKQPLTIFLLSAFRFDLATQAFMKSFPPPQRTKVAIVNAILTCPATGISGPDSTRSGAGVGVTSICISTGKETDFPFAVAI